jgi:hypothetical protein
MPPEPTDPTSLSLQTTRITRLSDALDFVSCRRSPQRLTLLAETA